MKTVSEHLSPLLSFLCLLILVPATCLHAEKSECYQAADRWILQLNDPQNTELFKRYSYQNCEFSGKWIKKSADITSESHRERMCQDLVLIWSHKNCNFFRDLINPEAYEPCKAWSREMHQRCMQKDTDWFP